MNAVNNDEQTSLTLIHDSMNPVFIEKRVFEATTDIGNQHTRIYATNDLTGLRPTQEDRFVLVPTFLRSNASFCGIFDGTVGDDASEFVSTNIVPAFYAAGEFADLKNSIFTVEPSTRESIDAVAEKIRKALKQSFSQADSALIQMCTEKKLHYASSTGVAVFLWGNLLTVAHVGDSKACIARQVIRLQCLFAV
ncbi:unnamed protein product [Sphagnum jensenii]|uniref:protein-serine/threonine phosphatase n=1 Tax=Sphagnum jensenii TaxID=128206 RepID=A0ABP0VCL1_9BRYO